MLVVPICHNNDRQLMLLNILSEIVNLSFAEVIFCIYNQKSPVILSIESCKFVLKYLHMVVTMLTMSLMHQNIVRVHIVTVPFKKDKENCSKNITL